MLATLTARAAAELQARRAQRLGELLGPVPHGDSPRRHPVGGRAASAYGPCEVKEVLAHLQRRGLVQLGGHIGGGGSGLGGGEDATD